MSKHIGKGSNPKTAAAAQNMINEQLAYKKREQDQTAKQIEIAKQNLEAHALAEAKNSRNLSLSYSLGYHANVTAVAVDKDEIIKTAKVFESYITGEI